MTFPLSLTIDVDGEAGLAQPGVDHRDRLTSRSERRYGISRGLPRILDALDEFDAAATFYVPGVTALCHRDEIGALAASRHEVAHHGHAHLRPDTMPEARQRADVVAGLEALEDVTGSRPRGYRAPGWELTPATLAALGELGFAYDSSLMGDDRPYRIAAGDGELVELPVHWSLDDAPHFARFLDPATLLTIWRHELRAAAEESRHLTVTVHPEIIGRPHRVDLLRRLLVDAAALGATCVTHADAALHAGAA
jgi:peptidoglycan/xylan/chitin deacetylase (PgdA/CDA1 family)